MVDRKQCRQNTWNTEEWNEVVSGTTAIIQKMETRILEPLPFSPSK